MTHHSLPDELVPRFLAKFERGDAAECWPWRAYRTKRGYGQMRYRGRTFYAHRLSYSYFVGPIPAKRSLDHLCRSPSCVNPAHLEPVTQRENARRGLKGALRTHCKNGHLMSEANTYVYPSNGHRACRECMRLKQRRRKAKARA